MRRYIFSIITIQAARGIQAAVRIPVDEMSMEPSPKVNEPYCAETLLPLNTVSPTVASATERFAVPLTEPITSTQPLAAKWISCPKPLEALLLETLKTPFAAMDSEVPCRQIAPPLDADAVLPVIVVMPLETVRLPLHTAPPPRVLPPAVLLVKVQPASVTWPPEELAAMAPPKAEAWLLQKVLVLPSSDWCDPVAG